MLYVARFLKLPVVISRFTCKVQFVSLQCQNINIIEWVCPSARGWVLVYYSVEVNKNPLQIFNIYNTWHKL